MTFFDSIKPKKVIESGPATTFFWPDGTKTTVKRGKFVKADKYDAYSAAIVKKIFGTRNALKRFYDGAVEEMNAPASKEQNVQDASANTEQKLNNKTETDDTIPKKVGTIRVGTVVIPTVSLFKNPGIVVRAEAEDCTATVRFTNGFTREFYKNNLTKVDDELFNKMFAPGTMVRLCSGENAPSFADGWTREKNRYVGHLGLIVNRDEKYKCGFDVLVFGPNGTQKLITWDSRYMIA
jgi:hypothetical protein